MAISSQIQNLNQLLSNNSERFEVPAYQRRYSWKQKQVNALFQDINSLSDVPGNNDLHLLGMIILHKPHSHNNVIEVVDGQQRLTTITILLKSIKDAYLSLDNDVKAGQVGSYLKVQNWGANNYLNKLTLGNMDNTDYSSMLMDLVPNPYSNEKIRDAKRFLMKNSPPLVKRQ
jgi:uncharacterized protein with ParB-like and HNH nuclease domain